MIGLQITCMRTATANIALAIWPAGRAANGQKYRYWAAAQARTKNIGLWVASSNCCTFIGYIEKPGWKDKKLY